MPTVRPHSVKSGIRKLSAVGVFMSLVILTSLLQSSPACAQVSAPKIEVVYPKEGQDIAAYDSTFILGNVTPGSTLLINGTPVKVYSNGAFLAFLPIQGGDFQFELVAQKGPVATNSVLKVRVPQRPRTTPADSFRIEPNEKLPKDNLVLIPGDLLEVRFRGTPGCKAFFKIGGLTDWMVMAESQSGISQPRTGEIFSTSDISDILPGKGVYTGIYKIKEQDQKDSARVHFRLAKTATAEAGGSNDGRNAKNGWKKPKLSPGSFSIAVEDSSPARITIVSNAIPQIVELQDTSQILPRTGPGLLYWYLFQANGTRAVATGKDGRWLRLKLTENEFAWIEEEKLRYLPLGTLPPQSNVSSLRTKKVGNGVQALFSLSQKLPFKVSQSMNPPGLTVDIYYATSNLNLMRLDPADKIIRDISWDQVGNDHFRARITLNQKQPWGFDIYYRGTNLILEIKPAPIRGGDLKGLVIAVDAGHSADDGAKGPTGLTERVANLEIAKRLKTILERHGAKVIMTRNEMENVSLNQRSKIAQDAGVNIFISVHNNSHPDGVNPFVNTGSSVYFYHPQSKALAEAVHSHLIEDLGIGDQGLYQANFSVLRSPQFLSILVECAFMIHPEQELRLREATFQEKAARAIYQGLAKFLAGLGSE